jgi:hypothetical protein
MAKVKLKKQEPKKTINVPMKSSDIVKPGYGENGRKLRPNYEKEQVKMANEGGLYGKKKK